MQTQSAHDVAETLNQRHFNVAVTMIQRRNNAVCPVGNVMIFMSNIGSIVLLALYMPYEATLPVVHRCNHNGSID